MMKRLWLLGLILCCLATSANAFWVGGGSGGGSGGAGIPGGANTQIQFNDDGVFAGGTETTFNKTTGKATYKKAVDIGVVEGGGYTGDLQNNGGGTWGKKYALTVTAPAQALSNGYSVRVVFSDSDASSVYNAGTKSLRIEHSITSPAATTLNGAINATVTTITVVSTAGYPDTGGIILNGAGEKCAYVGKTATQFLNVVRGAYGSTAASYASGVAVDYVKEMERHIETFTYSSVVVWFKIRANIAALATDTNYTLYFSNGSAGAAPSNTKSVFLFAEDFSGNLDDWAISAGSAEDIVGIVDGTLRSYQTVTPVKTAQKLIANTGDLAFCYKVKNAITPSNSGIGILNSNQADGTGFFAFFHSTYFNLYSRTPGVWTNLSNTQGSFALNTWDNYTIRVIGNDYSFYKNNVQVGITSTIAVGDTKYFILPRFWNDDITDCSDQYYDDIFVRVLVAGDTSTIDGNFATAGEQQTIIDTIQRYIEVKFVAAI